MAENRKNKLQIRNSTIDFLVFTRDAHEDGIEVRVQDHDVWLTQKAIGQLFNVDRSVVTRHLKNIFEYGELSEDSVCAKFAQTADDGKTYNYKFYSLAAIIAVGYRINSERATQFRTWATKVLDTFTKQGSKILFLIQGVGKTIGSFTFGWDAMQIHLQAYFPRGILPGSASVPDKPAKIFSYPLAMLSRIRQSGVLRVPSSRQSSGLHVPFRWYDRLDSHLLHRLP